MPAEDVCILRRTFHLQRATYWFHAGLQDIEKALMRADVDRDKLKDRHNRPDAVAKGLELNDASKVHFTLWVSAQLTCYVLLQPSKPY